MKYITFTIIGIAIIFILIFSYFGIRSVMQGSQFSIHTSPETIVSQMRALNRWETASFTIEKVIDAGTQGNAFQELLYGDRILLIAHGEVIAGFDFSLMQPKDVSITGNTITVTFPKPQILSTQLDDSQTRVYDRKLGLLSKGDKDLESKARIAGEDEIRVAACKGNILGQATTTAKKQMITLLKGVGFTAVSIIVPSGSC